MQKYTMHRKRTSFCANPPKTKTFINSVYTEKDTQTSYTKTFEVYPQVIFENGRHLQHKNNLQQLQLKDRKKNIKEKQLPNKNLDLSNLQKNMDTPGR